MRDAVSGNAAEAAVAAVRQRAEARAITDLNLPQTALLMPKAAAAPSAKTKAVLPARADVQKTSTSYQAYSYHTGGEAG